jgi:hypothetical protein
MLAGVFCPIPRLRKSAPLVRTLASHIVMAANDQIGYRLQCSGRLPTDGIRLTPQ